MVGAQSLFNEMAFCIQRYREPKHCDCAKRESLEGPEAAEQQPSGVRFSPLSGTWKLLGSLLLLHGTYERRSEMLVREYRWEQKGGDNKSSIERGQIIRHTSLRYILGAGNKQLPVKNRACSKCLRFSTNTSTDNNNNNDKTKMSSSQNKHR